MFDTQIMIENLGEYTTTNNESQADTVVINSCTVTNGADTGVRQYVSKLKKDYPEIKIMFTEAFARAPNKRDEMPVTPTILVP